jgi:uncharacterized protein YbjT (DUF2867 family)
MTIVVTGATGAVGRPLVHALHTAGVPVRAISRQPGTAGFPPEVAVLDTVADALPGATGLFLNSRALGDTLSDVVAAAAREGVTRLVALSALNADDDFSTQPSRLRGDRNKEVEQRAIESGLEWVSLRPTAFAGTVSSMWAPQIKAGDIVGGPYAAASMAPIVESDIGEVAAQAFLTDDLVGTKVPLTGPAAMTNTELVAAIGEVLNRPLRYQEAPNDMVRERFVANGLPAPFADAYIAMLAATIDNPATVTTNVQSILGRPATSWHQWIADNQHLFSN